MVYGARLHDAVRDILDCAAVNAHSHLLLMPLVAQGVPASRGALGVLLELLRTRQLAASTRAGSEC
jgi:hypothetical protein